MKEEELEKKKKKKKKKSKKWHKLLAISNTSSAYRRAIFEYIYL